jgi:hypothetical protein
VVESSPSGRVLAVAHPINLWPVERPWTATVIVA